MTFLLTIINEHQQINEFLNEKTKKNSNKQKTFQIKGTTLYICIYIYFFANA